MRRSFDAAFEGHVEHSVRKVAAAAVKMPWERSTVLYPLAALPAAFPAKSSYGTALYGEGSKPEVSAPPPDPGLNRPPGVRPEKSTATWEEQLDAERRAALAKWKVVIDKHGRHFELCRQTAADQPKCLRTALEEGLVHSFAGKSSATLSARAAPVLRYLAYCDNEGVAPFPLKEGVLWAYVTAEMQRSAPTYPKSFLSSLAFMKHVLGLDMEDAVISARVSGAAKTHYLTKRKLAQKDTLKVIHVEILESIVKQDTEIHFTCPERIMAGYFLYCLYGRARFSDGQASGDLRLDLAEVATKKHAYGYLEAAVTRTKTSFSLERKTRYLHMAAPVRGVTQGDPWGLQWHMDLKDQGPPLGPGRPLLPTMLTDGSWGSRPLKVDAAGKWLRHLLVRGGADPKEVKSVGTHSLKATPLAWCAKAGVPREDRAILGFHSRGVGGTELVYARDSVSAPLRALEKVLDDIRERRFRPDETRSGYYPQVIDESSSSTESSDDEEDRSAWLDEEAEEAAGVSFEPVAGLRAQLEPAELYRHLTSRALHRLEDEAGARFRCGRAPGASYAQQSAVPAVLFPMCKQCFPDGVWADTEGRPAVASVVQPFS